MPRIPELGESMKRRAVTDFVASWGDWPGYDACCAEWRAATQPLSRLYWRTLCEIVASNVEVWAAYAWRVLYQDGRRAPTAEACESLAERETHPVRRVEWYALARLRREHARLADVRLVGHARQLLDRMPASPAPRRDPTMDRAKALLATL